LTFGLQENERNAVKGEDGFFPSFMLPHGVEVVFLSSTMARVPSARPAFFGMFFCAFCNILAWSACWWVRLMLIVFAEFNVLPKEQQTAKFT
jgi:hypothetical protein